MQKNPRKSINSDDAIALSQRRALRDWPVRSKCHRYKRQFPGGNSQFLRKARALLIDAIPMGVRRCVIVEEGLHSASDTLVPNRHCGVTA